VPRWPGPARRTARGCPNSGSIRRKSVPSSCSRAPSHPGFPRMEGGLVRSLLGFGRRRRRDNLLLLLLLVLLLLLLLVLLLLLRTMCGCPRLSRGTRAAAAAAAASRSAVRARSEQQQNVKSRATQELLGARAQAECASESERNRGRECYSSRAVRAAPAPLENPIRPHLRGHHNLHQ